MAGVSMAVLARAGSVAAWKMPLLPKMENQAKMKPSGMNITPKTNSRKVRPREMRAMNSPTNGAQATHQAQKKMVQVDFQVAPCAPS